MKTRFTWLVAIGCSAMLTLVGFTAFSKLVGNDINLQTTDTQVRHKAILVLNKSIEPDYEPYQVKTLTKFSSVMEPKIALVTTCDYRMFPIPDQSVVAVKAPKPNFEISKELDIYSVTDRATPTCHAGSPLTQRLAPTMPANATKSGHCRLAFQLGKDGHPFNVKTTFCSEDMFAEPSIKAAQRWRYSVCNQGDDFDTELTRETSVTYILQDENGEIISE